MNAPLSKPSLTDISLLTLLALIFASAFLAIKVVVPQAGPWWLAAIRVSIAFLFLAPIALTKHIVHKDKMRWPCSFREWRLVILVSLLNVVAPFFLISWAEKSLDAGMTSLLMGVAPFIAFIASHFATSDERLSIAKVLGVSIAFSGILILVGSDVITHLGQNLFAQGLVIMAATCYVISGLTVRRLSGFSSLSVSVIVMGLASAFSLVIAYLVEGWPRNQFENQTWLGLVYLGLVPTGVGILLRYYLVLRVGVTVFSVGMSIIPIFGVSLSVMFLGEQLTISLLAALVLVLAGQFIVLRRSN